MGTADFYVEGANGSPGCGGWSYAAKGAEGIGGRGCRVASDFRHVRGGGVGRSWCGRQAHMTEIGGSPTARASVPTAHVAGLAGRCAATKRRAGVAPLRGERREQVARVGDAFLRAREL